MSKLCTDGVYKIGERFKVLLAIRMGDVGYAVAVLVANVNIAPRHSMKARIDGPEMRVLHVVLLLDEASVASSCLGISL